MNPKQKQLLVVGVIVVIAIVAVGVVIAMSGQRNTTAVDYAAIPQSRAEDGAFVLGNPDAPVTIIEFADFACPHCQNYHPEIQRFIADYVATGKARFEYRLFATSAGGQQSVFTSQLAECADEITPGAFWRAYDVLYELGATGQYFNQDAGRIVADRAGVSSYSELLTCSGSADQITIDMEFGRQNGVEGTPAVMVRYNNGPAEWISYNGTTYSRGNVSYSILAGVVDQFS